MLHDIAPMKFDNQYVHGVEPEKDSYMIITDGRNVIFKEDETLPVYEECEIERCQYVFSIDEKEFFLAEGSCEKGSMINPRFVKNKELWIAYAAACGKHIRNWYVENRFCGKCGKEMHHSETERAMQCDCGHIVYPRINPVVIVGVLNGNKLLTTRYSINHSAYRGYALIAGFAEFGESLEQTVEREVLEETGVHVKNIRFYKSQPWPESQSLISGFFCDLDGDDTLSIDENELEMAEWHTKDEIPAMNDNMSITGEMIELFRAGGIRGEK